MGPVLVTGFEPFDGQRVNPSAQVALALDGRSVRGRPIVGVVLPCAFSEARAALRRQLARLEPELVICTGQAGGRAAISVERVAINVNDAPMADNRGQKPSDRPVIKNGPVGYWSTLPIKAIVRALTRAGLPAEVSQTAGTFVCNHAFYTLMHTLAQLNGVRGGFVHLPYLPQQARKRRAPSLSLTDAVRGIELCVATSLAARRSVRAPR